MKSTPKETPRAFRLKYEELAPDMKQYAGVWWVAEDCPDSEHPFAERIAEIKRRARERTKAEEAARANRKSERTTRLRKAVAA